MSHSTQVDFLRYNRSVALESHAALESSLVVLLGSLLRTTHDIAATVFFEITSVRSRNTMIQNLLQQRYGEKYSAYWYGKAREANKKKHPGLFSHITALDESRNQIVHWHPVGMKDAHGNDDMELRPAYYWARKPGAIPLTVNHLAIFSLKAQFVARSVQMFWRFTTKPHSFSEAELQVWTGIFQQPAPYPPSNDHPLFPR